MSDFFAFFQAILALVFVLGLIALCALAARRYAPQLMNGIRQQRRLRLVEILPLGMRHRAALLHCDGREYLIILGEGGATLIARDLIPASPSPTGDKLPSPTGDNAPPLHEDRAS